MISLPHSSWLLLHEDGVTASGGTESHARRYRELAARVKPYVADTVRYINDAHKAGKSILVEGANATMLDINFGTYPYVTSSSPSIGGVIAGMGLAHNKFQVRARPHR
jgi:adenylosuccinate synthase